MFYTYSDTGKSLAHVKFWKKNEKKIKTLIKINLIIYVVEVFQLSSFQKNIYIIKILNFGFFSIILDLKKYIKNER